MNIMLQVIETINLSGTCLLSYQIKGEVGSFSSAILYLSCASPLWSVCEVTDTDPHPTAWTSSSPARLWKHTKVCHTHYAPCLHVWRHALPLRVMPLSICILCICMSWWKWKHTHPSLSISSVLKVNTWNWSIKYSCEFKALCTNNKVPIQQSKKESILIKNTAFNFYRSVEVSLAQHA